MKPSEVVKYKAYLNSLFGINSLDERDVNFWCDLIEFLCFTSKDKEIFREDIEQEIEMYVDGGIQLTALKEVSLQMGYDVPDAHIFSNDGDIDWGSDDASKNDLLEQLTKIWFTHLSQRQEEFGKFYPFIVSPDHSFISLKLDTKKLTKANNIYLYLLLTSNRNGLSRAKQRRLELDFEPIAFEAFKSYIPHGGEAHLMGKGSHTTPAFKVNKFKKFKLLSDTLKVGLKITENYFHPKDSGENGIDYIGWLTFQDNLPNNYVFAGQATCMREWHLKYNESSKQELGGILDTSMIGSYTNALFIPYHFRVGSNWARPHFIEAKDFILFDRFRILKSLNKRNIDEVLLSIPIISALA